MGWERPEEKRLSVCTEPEDLGPGKVFQMHLSAPFPAMREPKSGKHLSTMALHCFLRLACSDGQCFEVIELDSPKDPTEIGR